MTTTLSRFVTSTSYSIIALALFTSHLPGQNIPGKFYEYQILSMTGQTPLNAAQALTGLGAPSINSNGTVAYYGQFTGGEGIVAASPTIPATLISFAPPISNRFFGLTCQIDDAEQVLASDFTPGSPASYYERLWYVKSPGTDKTLAKGGAGQAYNSVLSNGSVNANGDAVFPGLDHSANTILISVKGGTAVVTLTLPNGSFPFPQIADTGDILTRVGNQANSPITVYDQNLAPKVTLADSSRFNVLGNQPGISADGLVVAFYGEPNSTLAATLGPGPGIFAAINLVSSWMLIRVTGTQYEVPGSGGNNNGRCDPGETCLPNAELGYSDSGLGLYFSSYSKDTRIAVTNLGLGAAGVDDDSFVISFMATPVGASRTNPVLGNGIPLLFSGNLGLWTIRVDVQHDLTAPSTRVFHATTAIPAVQVNDRIGGNIISSIGVFDPLANAAKDDAGKIRTMRRGDHRIAFMATTTGGQQLIVRGSHLDSDQDGLLDHWETTGIDMDQDGVIDLDLPSMGANPNKRDIFMEIDWLADQSNASFEPLPGVISAAPGQTVSPLVDMFNKAPSLAGNLYGLRSDGGTPATIPGGITLHVDGGSSVDQAGNPLSINMGTATLDGGDQIGASGTSSAGLAEVIYFGAPGEVSAPGVTTRPFQDVKDNYFGLHDKDGRELAFHYVLFMDYIGLESDASGVMNWDVASATSTTLVSQSTLPTLQNGDVVKVTGGTGSGQLNVVLSSQTASKTITVFRPWSTVPDATSSFVVLKGNQGEAEVNFAPSPDNNSLPGNDLMIAMGSNGLMGTTTAPLVGPPVYGNSCIHFRTLAHELGHNLGLRHGGTDHSSHKGTNYLSLMSYSYSSVCTPVSAVQSYSGATDPTFDDWANLRHDVPDVAFHLGNSLGLALGPVPEETQQAPELTGLDYVNQNGPADHTPPAITIQSPAAGGKVGLTLPLHVIVNATDNSAIASVTVTLDVNGDGDTKDSGEKVLAKLSGMTYVAGFAALSGSTGSRTITVSAIDASGNWTTKSESVSVVQPNPVPALASLSPGSATRGGASFTLTVNGSGFVSGSLVQWNGANRSTTLVNGGQVTAKIPASDIASAGTATVTVKNSAPGGGVSNGLPFQIN